MDMETEPEPVVNDDPADVPNQNPETYCRFCFSESEVEPLFPGNGSLPNAELMDRLYECIGIRLTKEDYCPSGICWMCSLTMEEFQCFRKRCLKFDKLVRSLRPTVKHEPPALPAAVPNETKPYTKQPMTIVRQDKNSLKTPGATPEQLRFKCGLCPRTFKHKMYLDQHFWIHRDRSGEEPTRNKKLQTNGASSKKENSGANITADRPIACEFCPRQFTRRMYYIQHLRKHKPEDRLYRCRRCARSFSSQLRRTAHERKVHCQLPIPATEEKESFSCPKCSREFKHRSSLRMHLLNHDGRLPYGCDICFCRFYSVSYLALHKKRYHGPNAERGVANGTSVQCFYCTRWFLRDCDRSSHIKQMHADIHASNESAAGAKEEVTECPPADTEEMTDPEMLPPNIHEPVMEIKEEEPDTDDPHPNSVIVNQDEGGDAGSFPFYCYSCAMPFETEDMYAEHLDDQHPVGGEQLMDQMHSSSPVEQEGKEFHCPFCPKTFTRKWSMTQHIPTHLAKKGYQCEYCPAIFTRNEYLRTHRQRKHPTEPETGSHKCSYCPRLFHKARYKKVHERIAHIKKGDVLPEVDPESQQATLNTTGDKFDESSSSMAHGPHSRTSDSFDQTSNDGASVVSCQDYDLEASSRLIVVLERMSPETLAAYEWQLELYRSMETPEEVPSEIEMFPPDNDAESIAPNVDPSESNESPKSAIKRKRSKFGITLHPCGVCPKMFKTRTAMRMHSLYHSGELPFRCDSCGVQFMRHNQLEFHKTKYHSVNSTVVADRYSCDYCPRIFLRKQDRTTHQMMVHARDQAEDLEDGSPTPMLSKKSKWLDYVCRVCDEQFDRYRKCQRHVTVVHPTLEGGGENKPIKLCHCHICAGTYKKREDWHEHLNEHPSVRPHHCEQCIRRRRKTTSRKQVHRCSFCPKAFENKPNLASHLRIHKQQLRFPCSECGVMYDRYRDLTTHQLRYHSQNASETLPRREPLQKCNFCPRIFTRLRDVKYHQEQVHADQVMPDLNESELEQTNDVDALSSLACEPEMYSLFASSTVLPETETELLIKPDPDQTPL